MILLHTFQENNRIAEVHLDQGKYQIFFYQGDVRMKNRIVDTEDDAEIIAEDWVLGV